MNFLVYNEKLFVFLAIHKGYQPRTNLVKDYKGDQLAHSHSILSKRKSYFFQFTAVNT